MMARLNETSKDAHDQGAQNDTQTIPAESHLEYGDFENDDDLTEAEKATIRQKLATRKRQVTLAVETAKATARTRAMTSTPLNADDSLVDSLLRKPLSQRIRLL
ncbi:hypothetical protein A1F94_002589 [Pyrenophora tritici-repentis]|nr:hypothetical protein A1F94_013196 [Pyrenophora tritici-repentis]KAG9385839.1 hypothetical protein A1F94_002589 [Pyrenophora tritici-repentis]